MQKGENTSKIIIIVFFIIFLLWSLLQFISPAALTEGSITDLSGMTGVSDNKKIIDKLSFPWGVVYSCGDRLCHQKVERSFFINGNQMPFCSRCTAIWFGIAIGLGFMIFYKIKLTSNFLFLIFLGFVPIFIDGFGQLFGFWDSSNIIRVLTGLLVGFVSGIAIGIIIDETLDIYNDRKNKHEN